MNTPQPASVRVAWIAAIVAAVACIAFAASTGHTWEDYYITFRSSLNLARGQGLVYQPGERLHTFTSPLGTLLPALFAVGGGADVATRSLWCFRLLSAACLGTAVWLAVRRMSRDGLGALAVAAGVGLWVLDAKTIGFSINGMESALLVLFILISWLGLAGEPRLALCAIGLAGLQWTRPDGVVFFAALAVPAILFRLNESSRWSGRFAAVCRSAVVGLLLYLPWIAFAWIYYGSPIPHTIDAKVSHYAPGELAPALLLYPWRLFFGHVALHDVFLPAYHFFGGWPHALYWISRALAVGAAIAWILPGTRRAGRVASLAFMLGGWYVEYIPRSPWYYPGWEALGFLSWAYLADAILSAGTARTAVVSLVRVITVSLVVCWAGLLGCVTIQMRAQQAIIELGNRREIGLWLRDHAQAGDRVYLEPLGYIGYYSGLKMLDYPGLSSREVVAARRAGARPHAGLIAALQPDWVVLRPDQALGVREENPRLLGEQYQLARVFDQRNAVAARSFLPGRGYLEFDAVYYVFHRVSPR